MWVPRQGSHHALVLGHLGHSLTHRVYGIVKQELGAGFVEVIPLCCSSPRVGVGRS